MLRMFPMVPMNTVMLVKTPDTRNLVIASISDSSSSGCPHLETIRPVELNIQFDILYNRNLLSFESHVIISIKTRLYQGLPEPKLRDDKQQRIAVAQHRLLP
jgi:hypothetical protein